MTAAKTILLFDMDSVLLEPGGYYQALLDTVALVGRALGFDRPPIRREDIDAFEALGVTSEWESSAVCTALMLTQVWEHQPDLRLPSSPPLTDQPIHALPIPNFQAFFRRMAGAGGTIADPLRTAQDLLSPGLDASQARVLADLLQKARGVESLTHRIFQELTLGSQAFAATYGLTPHLESASYLLRYDRPNLQDSDRAKLFAWLKGTGRHAAIFTNRPSSAPDGFFSTPEAEQGAECVGLQSLPILGYGGIAWLAELLGMPPKDLIKPSPVHALAALRLALGADQSAALKAAASLHGGTAGADPWRDLAGADVFVFEDSAKGMRSVTAAADLLAARGIRLQVELRGVCDVEAKRPPLEAVGAPIYLRLGEALSTLPAWPLEVTQSG